MFCLSNLLVARFYRVVAVLNICGELEMGRNVSDLLLIQVLGPNSFYRKESVVHIGLIGIIIDHSSRLKEVESYLSSIISPLNYRLFQRNGYLVLTQ